jgi:hypothetical protein
MASVISKRKNTFGSYEFKRNVELNHYPSNRWEYDPDISTVGSVPIRYWKYDGTNVVAEMSQVEKDIVDSNIVSKENRIIGGTIAFEKSGTVRNKWIGFGSSKSSNTTPYVIPTTMHVNGITYMNHVDGTDTDVELYKNGQKIFTWELRNKRWAWKTTDLNSIIFTPGDKIGIYLRDRGIDPRHVIITLHYTSLFSDDNEGGSETL